MVLGQSAHKNGYRATMFDFDDKGIFYFAGEGCAPRICRGHEVDGPAAKEIAARARIMREHAGRLTGYALGQDHDEDARNFAADVLLIFGDATESVVRDDRRPARRLDPRHVRGYHPGRRWQPAPRARHQGHHRPGDRQERPDRLLPGRRGGRECVGPAPECVVKTQHALTCGNVTGLNGLNTAPGPDLGCCDVEAADGEDADSQAHGGRPRWPGRRNSTSCAGAAGNRAACPHTCFSNSTRKATPKPAWSFGKCERCRKPVTNPLTHVCASSKGDFGRRRKAHEKAEKAAARKAAAKKRQASAHDYRACTDKDCARPLCVAYKTGYQLGDREGIRPRLPAG